MGLPALCGEYGAYLMFGGKSFNVLEPQCFSLKNGSIIWPGSLTEVLSRRIKYDNLSKRTVNVMKNCAHK